jgi:hypothetical protein
MRIRIRCPTLPLALVKDYLFLDSAVPSILALRSTVNHVLFNVRHLLVLLGSVISGSVNCGLCHSNSGYLKDLF